MSIKKDAADPRIPDVPLPFWVAVVAPWGFDAPQLDVLLARSLRGLLVRQPHPGLLAAMGQPVGRHAAAVCGRYGWRHQPLLGGRERATVLGLLAHADAAVLVGLVPAFAEKAARWAGVPVRRLVP